MNNKYTESYIYHHGILGMKWGQKNGPPYPLGTSDHSASEKKAGWEKSLNRESQTSSKKGVVNRIKDKVFKNSNNASVKDYYKKLIKNESIDKKEKKTLISKLKQEFDQQDVDDYKKPVNNSIRLRKNTTTMLGSLNRRF